MSTADAVDREAAWLAASGDTLPALLTTAGGPFGVVQAYWPRTPGKRTAGQLYVLRSHIQEERFANQRRMARHHFRLVLAWPLTDGAGNAEKDQRNFDAAIDKVLLRIGGLVGDKTHGGRFRSVAENPRDVQVAIDDPETSFRQSVGYGAVITYTADDNEITG